MLPLSWKESAPTLPKRPDREQNLTLKCALWDESVIFELENGIAVNLDGERHRNMISGFLWHE